MNTKVGYTSTKATKLPPMHYVPVDMSTKILSGENGPITGQVGRYGGRYV